MYASNEDEYNREDSEWVFLRQTPPINTVIRFFKNLFIILFILYLIQSIFF